MRLHLFILILALSTSACQNDSKTEQLKAGLHLSESISLSADTFYLDPLPGDSAVLTISGNDLVIDFNGAVLHSKANIQQPDQFQGWAIRILGGRNIELRNLNVRGFAGAIWAEEVEGLRIKYSDLSYLQRQTDTIAIHSEPRAVADFLPAAIYLQNCSSVELQEVTIHHCRHGIVLNHCSQGKVYNCQVRHQQGVGMALLHSTQNWLGHNQVDWNQWGIYVGNNSPKNTIAYNSVTHCETGFWLEDEKSEQQLLFDNDFSYATQQGVRLAGSQNMIYNRLNDCALAVEGQNMANSLVIGNQWQACDQDSVWLEKGANIWQDNSAAQRPDYSLVASYAPEPLTDGQTAFSTASQWKGRGYRLLDEWGPYDFREPRIWLRKVDGQRYTFGIFGPAGNWQVIGGQGFQSLSLKRSAIPTSLVAESEPGADTLALKLQFFGEAAQTGFGETIPRGAGPIFSWTNQ